MELDRQRLEQIAPFAIAVVLCAVGWMVLVQPRVTASSRAGREIEGIRQRLARARESVAGPAPEVPVNDAVTRFERVTGIRAPLPHLNRNRYPGYSEIAARVMADPGLDRKSVV